jgi:solute carrier family 25 (mitochondrial folate transporter), member 32
LCLQYGTESAQGVKAYSGMFDALSSIYKQEGMRGLYRGFIPGMFGVSHGALQFMTYEEMKNAYNQYRNLPIDSKLVTFTALFIFCFDLTFYFL